MEKPRLLIVDDNQAVRETCMLWFNRRGFETHAAQDGLEALQRVQDYRYNAVLLDLEMPRMSGKEALEKMMADDPTLPVIVVTGFAAEPHEVTDLGARRVVKKPFRLADLEEKVFEVMREYNDE